jgi:hypothetical protein
MKTELELKTFVRKKCYEFWGEIIPMDQLIVAFENFTFNSIQGCFSIRQGVPHISLRLDLEGEELKETLKHELVHFYLYSKKKDYRDTSEVFIRECLKLKVHLSEAENAQIAYRRYREKHELHFLSITDKLSVIDKVIKAGYVYSVRYMGQKEDEFHLPGNKGEHVCQIRNPKNREERYFGVGTCMENAVYFAYEIFSHKVMESVA